MCDFCPQCGLSYSRFYLSCGDLDGIKYCPRCEKDSYPAPDDYSDDSAELKKSDNKDELKNGRTI